MKTARVALILLSVSSSVPVLASPAEAPAKPKVGIARRVWRALMGGGKASEAKLTGTTAPAPTQPLVEATAPAKPAAVVEQAVNTEQARQIRESMQRREAAIEAREAATVAQVVPPAPVPTPTKVVATVPTAAPVSTPAPAPAIVKPAPAPVGTTHAPVGPSMTTPVSTLRVSSPSYASDDYYRWTPPPRPKMPYEKLAANKVAHVDKILRQGHRPTQAEFETLLSKTYGDKLPAENPFGSASHIERSSSEIADLIAQLERAYPGGTYLPLGRDAVAVADTLHAFYKSIGHPERARRLDMSGKSLPHYRSAGESTYENDAPIIHGFLKSQGLDLDKLDEKRPFVMVDITSYSPTSQSTQLMRSVYRTWSNMGRDPKELANKVVFVGLPMGGARFKISEIGDLDGAKDRLKSTITRNGPEDILYLGGSLGHLTYTRPWHQDFLRFETQGKEVISRVGEPTRDGEKLDVLAEMFEIHKMMSSGQMLRRVQEVAARKYGFELGADGVVKGRVAGAAIEKLPANNGPASLGRSVLLGAIESTLGSRPTSTNAVHFLQDIAGMRARSSMPNKEFRAALRTMAKFISLRDNPRLEAKLAKVYADYPGFREDLSKQLFRSTYKD